MLSIRQETSSFRGGGGGAKRLEELPLAQLNHLQRSLGWEKRKAKRSRTFTARSAVPVQAPFLHKCCYLPVTQFVQEGSRYCEFPETSSDCFWSVYRVVYVYLDSNLFINYCKNFPTLVAAAVCTLDKYVQRTYIRIFLHTVVVPSTPSKNHPLEKFERSNPQSGR